MCLCFGCGGVGGVGGEWVGAWTDTESAFAQTTIPPNIHTANRIFTNN